MMRAMKRTDFHFDLPDDRIARYPTPERTASRLLALDGASGQHRDLMFADIERLLSPGDLLVLNNTRVIPARVFGRKSTGGQIEVLVERVLDERTLLAHIRSSKSPKPGSEVYIGDDRPATMIERRDDLFVLTLAGDEPAVTWLERVGHMPLPPYIDRADELSDRERYQTVFAAQPGAVAAPTAGLHFSHELLERLAAKGVERAFVTLHVGSGTFQPVRADDIREHQMHAEWLSVPGAVVDAVAATRARGGRVIAVGTTAVRSLETAAQSGVLSAYEGESRLFIYPGYQFNVVDAMVTNFHLPESTLLMLVSAFAGREPVLAAYRHAVAAEYRFFSYGDAMFITRGCA